MHSMCEATSCKREATRGTEHVPAGRTSHEAVLLPSGARLCHGPRPHHAAAVARRKPHIAAAGALGASKRYCRGGAGTNFPRGPQHLQRTPPRMACLCVQSFVLDDVCTVGGRCGLLLHLINPGLKLAGAAGAQREGGRPRQQCGRTPGPAQLYVYNVNWQQEVPGCPLASSWQGDQRWLNSPTSYRGPMSATDSLSAWHKMQKVWLRKGPGALRQDLGSCAPGPNFPRPRCAPT